MPRTQAKPSHTPMCINLERASFYSASINIPAYLQLREMHISCESLQYPYSLPHLHVWLHGLAMPWWWNHDSSSRYLQHRRRFPRVRAHA
jgi:hypothetical protein